MEKYQHDLLENIFLMMVLYIKRIGDKNQAIYSGKISLEEIWENRQKCLSLKGSHRLSPNIAQVVNKFALDNAVNKHDVNPKPQGLLDKFGEIVKKPLTAVKNKN